MSAVSAWTITVQSDLATREPVFEKMLPGFTLQGFNTGDSFWIACVWPNGSKVAFRAAFAFSGSFIKVKAAEKEGRMHLKMETALGKYEIVLEVPDTGTPLFHYTTSFRPLSPILIPFSPRDIVPLTKTGEIENTTGEIHSHQVGSRTGQVFFSIKRPHTGSVFYLQNLTSLNDYCEATQTSAAETVGGVWPEIGFRLPFAEAKPLPAGKFVISDAYVIPATETPDGAFAIAEQYLDKLSSVYLKIPKPPTIYRNWPEISQNGLDDLTRNKGCWTYADGNPYLNAYLCDYKTPPEIMVQLAVMIELTEYSKWVGHKFTIIDEIRDGLPAFYDEKVKTLSRWLPSMRGNLDASEEQKKPLVMDSWYLHHPLMNLAKLALSGDKLAEKLVLDSVGFAIKAARHFDYEWPVFYKMDTLETIKAETAEGQGGEKDVAGGYGLLMLDLWKLTGDTLYFNEAAKAIRKLEKFGTSIFYQANTTAFAALASLRLFRETKDSRYLQISYLCLAGIFKNVQLWESQYGNGKYFPHFLGVFPLSDAPYKAPYEELEVFATLNDYIKEAAVANAKLLPALTILIPELLRYGIHRLLFYYPPMLPKNILSDEVKTGQLDPNLWIPLEDLYDGWEKNGQVGQEVYGAGVGFGIVPRQYIKIRKGNFMLYTDYPISNLVIKAKSLSFEIIGDSRLACRVIAIPDNPAEATVFTLARKSGRRNHMFEGIQKADGCYEFAAAGQAALTLKWK